MKELLTWPVKIVPDATITSYQIISDPVEKVHYVYVRPDQPLDKYQLSHELAHAVLAERVHPAFAGVGLSRELERSRRKRHLATTAYRVATEWFVDELRYQHHPESERKELLELISHPETLRLIAEHEPFSLGLLCAEARRWLGVEVEHPLVDVFLEVDPAQPSLGALVRLINRLLEVRGSKLRCRIDTEKGVPVLKER